VEETTVRTIDLSFDVTAATPFGQPQRVAGTLFAPNDGASASGHLVVGLPGGSCSRFYYDAHFPGLSNYSLAEYLTDRGRFVLALDHLGMGDSSKPEPESRLDRIIVADANHRATLETADGLRSGRWFAPCPRIELIGVGHSLGGMMAITQQARFESFDRLAVLGWTNIGLVLPDFDPGELAGPTGGGYLPAARDRMRGLFHLADVPEALIAYDDARASVTPACLARDAMNPSTVAGDAAAIDCPLFLLFSEVDVSPDPSRELGYFPQASDVTFVRLNGAAHMQNYATTRARYWARMDSWIGSPTI